MKSPDDIKKGLECCPVCSKSCAYHAGIDCYAELHYDALSYIQQLEQREWDLFDLLSSAWHGKQYYSKQEDDSVYSRESCQYLTFDQAIDEFAHSLTVAGDINVPSWISVEERLPDDLEEVLILVKETEFYGQYKELSKSYFYQYIGCVDDGEWFTVWCHGHRYIKDTAKEPFTDKLEVTHWMPLPSPPKEDE